MGRLQKNSKRGFTLLEVVIALAVFAFLIGGLLGFLPWSVEGVSKVKEQDTAYGLVDSVNIELERMGFSMVEASTNRLSGLYSSFDMPRESSMQLDLLLVARREGRPSWRQSPKPEARPWWQWEEPHSTKRALP